MATKRIAGTAFVKLSNADGNSRQLALRGSWRINVDAFTREGIAGLDGVHGYKETPMVPYMVGNFSLTDGTSVDDIAAITDATITTELANGSVYLLRNAWSAESREIDADEGQIEVRFEGLEGDELKPAA